MVITFLFHFEPASLVILIKTAVVEATGAKIRSAHCTDFKDLRDDEDIVINREWILNKLSEEEN